MTALPVDDVVIDRDRGVRINGEWLRWPVLSASVRSAPAEVATLTIELAIPNATVELGE